jgi:hypothetical protein
VHGLHQEAEFLGQFFAHALDAPHQFAALIAVHQRNEPIADFEADQIDGLHIVPGQLLLLGGNRPRPRRRFAATAFSARAILADVVGADAHAAAMNRNTRLGIPGMTPSSVNMPAVTPARAAGPAPAT